MHSALFGFFIPPSWYPQISNFFRALGKRLTFAHKGFRVVFRRGPARITFTHAGLRVLFKRLPVRLIFRGVSDTTLRQGEKRYVDIGASKPLASGATAVWNLYNAAGAQLLANQTADVDYANGLVSALLDTTPYSPGNYTVEFRVTNGQELIIHCEPVTIQA